MLSGSIKCAPEGLQVLNISNVNAQNEIVLNDELLLSLIQQYPFLFNIHVKPYNDVDFNDWAWEQISKSFNRAYENMNRSWSKDELSERWKILQPIVRSLSKINNIKSLPETLRQTVVKMSVPMEEKATDHNKKPMSLAQTTLLAYEPLVNSLSVENRRRLEAEMMELILNSELESKATIKVGSLELQTIENEYNEFLKLIGLDEIYIPEMNIAIKTEETRNSPNSNIPNNTNISSNIDIPNNIEMLNNTNAPINTNVPNNSNLPNDTNVSNDNNSPNVPNDTNLPNVASIPKMSNNTNKPNNANIANNSNSIKMPNEQPTKAKIPNNKKSNLKIKNEKIDLNLEKKIPCDNALPAKKNDNNLLKPLKRHNWVPLDRWQEYTRKCRVRVKRHVMEDDLPLITIKREKI